VLALDAVGEADMAAHAPIRTNSVFWIASNEADDRALT
jgi:hypothetical protein